MKRFGNIAVVAGIAVYFAIFYGVRLAGVFNDAGRPLTRIELLEQLFWLPDQWLLPVWFGMPPSFSLIDRIPVFLIAGTILGWGTLLGWLLCVAMKLQTRLTKLEMWIFSAAVGLNLISTWVLLLGLFGVMDRLWVFIVPALATLSAFWYARKTYHRPFPGNGTGKKTECGIGAFNNPLDIRWLWLGVPFALMIFLAAALPPLDFDVREYHLQAPKEFYLQGQITFLPHNVYANMAMGAEMHSLLAMILANDWLLGALAGKIVIAAFAPLTALGLFAAGLRFFSPAAGVVAALVYLSIPWVVSIASGGLIESVSAFYLFLAVYALFLHRDYRTMSFMLLAGYFTGTAVATKYPAALFVLIPLALWVALTSGRELSTSATLQSAMAERGKTLAVFLLAAFIGCGLWFGKNWVLTGNPTYPLLYNVFDGRSWNADKEAQWNRVHRPHDFALKTLGRDLGRVVLTSEWLSPLVVPLSVLAFFGLGRFFAGRWKLLAYLIFIVASWWLLTHRIDRFWIPMLSVAALLAGVGACWSAERWWRWCLIATLIFGLGANFLTASMGMGNAWFVPLAKLRTAPGWIDPWHAYFNAQASEGRLLAVGDAAVFDVSMPVLYNTCFDDCLFEQIVKDKTPAEIRELLAAQDIVYIYVNWAEIERYRKTYGFTEFVRPEVFERLVSQGILAPLPMIEGVWAQGYRVLP